MGNPGLGFAANYPYMASFLEPVSARLPRKNIGLKKNPSQHDQGSFSRRKLECDRGSFAIGCNFCGCEFKCVEAMIVSHLLGKWIFVVVDRGDFVGRVNLLDGDVLGTDNVLVACGNGRKGAG